MGLNEPAKARKESSGRILAVAVSNGFAVGFAAVDDAIDLAGVFALRFGESAAITAAQAEVGARRLELFYVAGAGSQVAVQAVKNLQGGLAIYRSEIGAGFRRPDHDKT